MPTLPHNQRAIDALAPPAAGRDQYRSQVVVGLELEIMESGKRTWRLRYRVGRGRSRKFRAFTIGDAKNIKLGPAIDRARELLAAVQLEGRDPQKERTVSGDTFDDLFTDWFDRYAKLRRKSHAYDIALYNRHIKVRLGQDNINDITRSDFAALLDEVAKKISPTQANKVQTLISAVFGWGVNEGRLDSHPGYRLPKRGVEKARERVLSDEEIRLIWRGMEGGPLSLSMIHILRLALLTGQRRTEITEAQKAEVNFEDSAWTIPSTRTKNAVAQVVPLAPLALSILKAACSTGDKIKAVFPGRPGGGREVINPHAVSRAMARLTADLKIANPPTVHDLRRTVGTQLARLGVPKDIRARVLNHVSGARSVTDSVYNSFDYAEEKRRAMQVWEQRLQEILEGKATSNVRY